MFTFNTKNVIPLKLCRVVNLCRVIDGKGAAFRLEANDPRCETNNNGIKGMPDVCGGSVCRIVCAVIDDSFRRVRGELTFKFGHCYLKCVHDSSFLKYLFGVVVW